MRNDQTIIFTLKVDLMATQVMLCSANNNDLITPFSDNNL